MLDKRLKLLKILSIVLISLVILIVALLNIIIFFNLLTYVSNVLVIVITVLIPIFGFLFSFTLANFISYKNIKKTLIFENETRFGIKNFTFSNYDLFKKSLIGFKNKGDSEYYIIGFSPCSQDISTNITHNEIVAKYNGLIAQFIEEYFENNIEYDKYDHFYFYHRNMFIIFVQGNENRINNILEHFETQLYEIAKTNEIRLFIQPFFGIAKLEVDQTIDEALENAALAKYQAEKNFESSSFYTPELKTGAKLSDTDDLLEGLKNNEFEVFYQPKFSLNTHSFISSEALVRWNSSKHGFLSPSQFIDKVERAGLIHDLDMYVFKKVCEDINETKRRGRRVIPVSINFSLYEFYSPTFVADIIKIIDDYKVARNLIEIEITETTTQSNPFLAISIMKQLKEKGLRILMDDFGTGYSNFANLRKIPIDAIKIDKSFIDYIVSDAKTKEIVRFLIALGKNTNLEVIAEGVDKKEQIEILKKAHLDTIQGYYYSKPLPKAEYEQFLISNPFEKKGETKWF